ncbi:MAG TPA: prepilin-type N-terminal cleavage/methylation domain-containing protein [Armatimonadota bacterium]|jgi:prepilin-type N-terminal cleavage/methylation domain-containing protein/prepilin-type processing-associated H-X9-DG protein
MQRRGFTLIELLVVIAIIAILAAILFPVFARARAKAQQSNCLSNVKQLTLGMLMYVSDNDERIAPIGWAGFGAWPNLILPYVKNQQIFLCPSSSKYSGANWPSVNYAQSQNLAAIAQNSIKQPAKTIFVLEADAAGGRGFGTADLTFMYGCSTEAAYDNMTVRHNGGANYGFADGHAKWLKPDAISAAGACNVNRCGLNPGADPACSGFNIKGGNVGTAALGAAMTWDYDY